MPEQNEIRWSQLRVGALVAVAIAVLIGLIFLMTGSSGGLFTRKIKVRSYFDNASGLKNGAPVTLQGVTIGNVSRVRVMPSRNPTPVEVTMTLSNSDAALLHSDTTASIAQAGVLGDSYVDLDSTKASGPPPANNAELRGTGSPSIQDVIRTSKISIEEVSVLMRKVGVLVDSLNSRKGSMGELVNNPALYRKLTNIATDLEKIAKTMAGGKGSLGKFVNDETLYNRANSAITHLDNIASAIDQGKGSAGKLIHDDSLFKNLNAAVANTNQMLAEINAGKGTLGMVAKDPNFARKLDETVARLDNILQKVDSGKGTMGQLVNNPSLYDHTDQTVEQAGLLVSAIRANPKKYLDVHFRVF